MFAFVSALNIGMGIDKGMDLELDTIIDGIDLDNVGQVNSSSAPVPAEQPSTPQPSVFRSGVLEGECLAGTQQPQQGSNVGKRNVANASENAVTIENDL